MIDRFKTNFNIYKLYYQINMPLNIIIYHSIEKKEI